jgi:cation diffusion facilitator family transporter
MIADEELAARKRAGQATVIVGLVANLALAVAKSAAGVIGRSSGLISDGINSISDGVYYLIVIVFLRGAAKPADREHPYGHTQLESIASLVVGAFVLTTAVAILWHEITTLYEMSIGTAGLGEVGPVALWVALASIAVKAVLAWTTRRRGRVEQNSALIALGDDHASDIAASGAVAIGIVLARRGYAWVDPAAGAAVALLIFRTGLKILRNSATELMDAVPGESFAREIRERLAVIAAIRAIEDIRAHRFGPYFVVNLTIALDGSLTIAEGDRVCTLVERRLYDTMSQIRMVHVHYHPPRAAGDPPAR